MPVPFADEAAEWTEGEGDAAWSFLLPIWLIDKGFPRYR
jgi:hypothetical protein